MRAQVRFALSALSLAMLAGCAAAPPPADVAPVADTPRATPAPQVARTAPKLTVPAPADLIGVGDAALRRALGPASLVRRDMTGEIRQYRTDACVLFVFLYSEAGGAKVRHVESRGDGNVQSCIRGVVTAAQQSAG